MRKAARLAIPVILAISPAAAYYQYIHYANGSGGPPAIYEKFDLTALPNKTVTFFVSDPGTLIYGANDGMPSVLSQIRQATTVWNAVDSSDLRVAFGGVYNYGTPHSTPSGIVQFEDLPPGYIGLSTRTLGTPAYGPNGVFVPITEGAVHLNRNLTQSPGPSYVEKFYTTVVHEMGHALGLQHTFTSSAMSTYSTRATSRIKPLEADDIAGLSLLYPAQSFSINFGSITGRVTSGGQGVGMISVVALRPNGSAVSTLTHPDGSYRIDGLPMDGYWVYVQSLPDDADLQWPQDLNFQPVPVSASGPIETQFYPGTRDPLRFQMIPVTRGAVVAGIDFSVQRKPNGISGTYTYGAVNGVAVTPSYVNSNNARGILLIGGNGLFAGNQLASGLNIQVLGGTVTAGAPSFLESGYLTLPMTFPFSTTGQRHLLFTKGDDAWVQPAGLVLVQKAPPSLMQAIPNGDTVTVIGTNLGADTRIYFDGTPATVRVPFSGSDQVGTIVVAPPPASGGHVAVVTAVNSDGQHSLLAQSTPLLYYYPGFDTPAISIQPNSLPAGSTGMVEITGVSTRFTSGMTTLGLGSSDVTVNKVWVVSPTRLLANVTVSSGMAPGMSLPVSVIAGSQAVNLPYGFVTLPANPRLPAINTIQIANPVSTSITAGSALYLFGTNLGQAPATATVTVNDQPAQILAASAYQILFVVPQGTAAGPAVLKVNNGGDSSLPLVIQIDNGATSSDVTDTPQQ